MNLLRETRAVLREHGKNNNDVIWVGRRSINAVCSWGEFEKQAENIEYDDSYGIPEVPEDLVVVGVDWWLERASYDGSEWWEYKTFPTLCAGNKTDLELKIWRFW